MGPAARLALALRRLDSRPGLVAATRRARSRLPGDSLYCDSLSTAGDEPPQLLARQLAALGGERPSLARELGLGALQLWQGVSEAQGRGYGERELAIMFTDLIDFSSWALDAGDESAVELLRAVDRVQAGAIERHGGRVVKRLGDGLMAVFEDPVGAVDAALQACAGTASLEVAGHRPRLRAGIHLGRPRKLGSDYFGVDVNIAARVMAAAGAGEVLVSAPLRMKLPSERAGPAPGLRLQAKGAPRNLEVFALGRQDASG